jgi:Acyl-CoA dehydrogenase, C-terminal domain
MDLDELQLLRASLAQLTAANTGKALDEALVELGWRDALAADRRSAVSALFDLQGRANVTSSALQAVIALGLGRDPTATPAVVLPAFGDTEPAGDVAGEGVAVRGLGTFALPAGEQAVVVAGAAGAHVAVTVPIAELVIRPVSGVDPAAGIVEVTGTGIPAPTRSELEAGAWPAAVAAGQVAIAHELAGASRAMLQLARDHAVERIQFGRPIAAFQAVRHRLADSLVAIEAADAAIVAAWDRGDPLTASLAKAIAGHGARTVGRHCQQVLAGIGFTAEHPFHRYFRRILVLDGLLGDSRSLTRRLGEDLLRTRKLPSILPL